MIGFETDIMKLAHVMVENKCMVNPYTLISHINIGELFYGHLIICWDEKRQIVVTHQNGRLYTSKFDFAQQKFINTRLLWEKE